MSEAAATLGARGFGRWRPHPGLLAKAALVALAAVLPFYLSTALLQTGLFAMAAIIGAIGLNMLTGSTGQLSLAHSFFVGVGAYAYSFFAGTSGVFGTNKVSGFGLPPLLALVLAVVVAGFAGLLFSPLSSRLRGIYLGVASISLVFIGQHLMFNVPDVTGGFYGRAVAPFSLGGFTFTNTNPDLYVLGVPFGQYERLWYLALVLVVASYAFARNVLRGRPGRAMQTVRDSEIAAAVMGVSVRRYKASAFVLSSMYAGLAGVLYALTFTRIVPDAFGFTLAIDYLAMIVIGGLGSVGGAALGAVFVTALPQLLLQYSAAVPFLDRNGSGGVDAGSFSRYVYGLLIVLIVLFEPGGLAALGRRLDPLRGRSRSRPKGPPVAGPPVPPAGRLPGTGERTEDYQSPPSQAGMPT